MKTFTHRADQEGLQPKTFIAGSALLVLLILSMVFSPGRAYSASGPSVKLTISSINQTDKGFLVKGSVTGSGLNPGGQIVVYDGVSIIADVETGPNAKFPLLPQSMYVRAPNGAETPYTKGSGPGGTMTKIEADGVGITSVRISEFDLRKQPVWSAYGGLGVWSKNAPASVTKTFEGYIPLQYQGKTVRIRALLKHSWGGPYANWPAFSFANSIGYQGALKGKSNKVVIILYVPDSRYFAKTRRIIFGPAFPDFQIAKISGIVMWQSVFYQGHASSVPLKAILYYMHKPIRVVSGVTNKDGQYEISLEVNKKGKSKYRDFSDDLICSIHPNTSPPGPYWMNSGRSKVTQSAKKKIPPKKTGSAKDLKTSIWSHLSKLNALLKDYTYNKHGGKGTPNMDQWRKNHQAGNEAANALQLLVDIATGKVTGSAQTIENWVVTLKRFGVIKTNVNTPSKIGKNFKTHINDLKNAGLDFYSSGH